MKCFFSSGRNWVQKTGIPFLNTFVSFLIFLVLLALLFYMCLRVWNILENAYSGNFEHTLHDAIYIIVLVKAYKILLAYIQHHHIHIRYVLEVAIIAPIIEIVFVADAMSWYSMAVFGIFSLSALVIYFIFYDKVRQI